MKIKTAERIHPVRQPRTGKRGEILAAAETLFLRNGFIGTSIDEIAASAGVSRQTIYNNFTSKEALFLALADRFADQMLAPLRAPNLAKADPREVLLDVAERMLSLVLQPSSLAMHRLLVSEGPQFPQLARQLKEAWEERALGVIGDYLREQTRRGTVHVPDPALATEQFVGMLVGQRQMRALLGFGRDVEPQQIKAAALTTVDTFLRAYAS